MTSSIKITCDRCEEYLADLLDGTLGADLNAAMDVHLAACAACSELAADAGAAVALVDRAALVELPPTLVPQILTEITTGPSRVLVQKPLAERILGRWIRPLLQPRLAMSLALVALSIAMIPRYWRQNAPAPDRILMVAENRVFRTFDRAVKGYENLALVSDVQSQIDQWRTDAEDADVQDTRPGDAPGGAGVPRR